MLCQQSETVDDLLFIVNQIAASKPYYAFIPRRNPVFSEFCFDKNISFYADVRVSSQKIKLHSLPGTVKIHNDLTVDHFRAKRNRNDVWILLTVQSEPYRIAADQYTEYFIDIKNFSVFTSHPDNPR